MRALPCGGRGSSSVTTASITLPPLGRALAEVRGSLGISVPGLAALIADNRGPWGPGGWEHMVVLRMADITAIEAGTWKPRWVWEYIDTALNAGGTLLRIHDNLYAHQTVQASGKRLHGPERRHHRTEGCCAGKPACASGPAIAALTPDIAAVHARFHRSTVNIGVVGQVAAGKSMLLRTTTGLGEVVIPSGGLKSTTAVRSRILHSPGRADAQVLLRTWEGFRDGYLQPLHDDAGLMDGTVPITPCTMSGSTASSRSAGWRTLSSWTCPARARPR